MFFFLQVEQFGHVQCNCMIGLFPEIDRAWLTIDSDIYVWRFEDQVRLNKLITVISRMRFIVTIIMKTHILRITKLGGALDF